MLLKMKPNSSSAVILHSIQQPHKTDCSFALICFKSIACCAAQRTHFSTLASCSMSMLDKIILLAVKDRLIRSLANQVNQLDEVRKAGESHGYNK